MVKTHPEEEKSVIAMVRGDWLIDFCIGIDGSRQFNFEDDLFKENYVAKYVGVQKDPHLKDGSLEWR